MTTAELNALDAAVALSDVSLTWAAVVAASVDSDDTVVDGDGNPDFIIGGSGDDTLSGLGGNDTLQGNDGNDVLDGGAGNDLLQGENGADHLMGGSGNDTLRDGSGSDLLEGGLGDDVYIWEGGSNDFVFDEGGHDVIRVENPTFIQFERVFTDDLLLTIGSDTLTLQDQLNNPTLFPAIEEIQDLAGSTVFNLENFTGTITTNGTAANDTIAGIQFGGSINDTLNGHDGDDLLIGGEGNDILYGGNGHDSLQGGLGNDTAWGGLGDDTYFYTHGFDVYDDRYGGSDVVNIASNYSLEDIEFFRAGAENDLRILIDGELRITLKNHFTSFLDGRFETLRLNDGTGDINLNNISYTTRGGSGNDSIAGVNFGAGTLDDIIYGLGGNDSIIDDASSLSSGDDMIDGGDGDDNITLRGGTNTVLGGTGDDSIIISGHFNNTIDGGEGSDSISYGGRTLGGGRELHVDISDPLNGFTKIFNPATGLYEGASDALISIENITGGSGKNISIGNQFNNHLQGSDGDLLQGGAGDDVLVAYGGTSTLEGGTGNDTYILTASTNTVFDAAGMDKLVVSSGFTFDEMAFTQDTNDLVVNIGGGNTTRIIDYFIGNTVEQIEIGNGIHLNLSDVVGGMFLTGGADTGVGTAGDDLINGKAGDDTITGLDGNDTLVGGAGADIIDGGNGNDFIYDTGGGNLLNGGDGDDEIISFSNNGITHGDAGNDTLRGWGESHRLYGDSGDDHIFLIGGDNSGYGGDGNDVFVGGSGEQSFDGGNGIDTVDYSASISAISLTLQFHVALDDTNNHDSIVGIERAIGSDFDDNMEGLDIADTLEGRAGNDILRGIGGNDLLLGGAGDDQYHIFSTNDGQDVITDSSGEMDTIHFFSNILYSDLIFTNIGDDLEISFTGSSTSKITILGHNSAGFNQIELLRFDADDSVVELVALIPNAAPIAQNDAFNADENETISGNVLNDNGGGADFDPDGHSFSVTPAALTTLNGGAVELLATGSFTYTPAAGYTGLDTFSYTITDSRGDNDTATVSITVEPLTFHAPVANNDLITGNQDQNIIGNVLTDNGNGADSDPDGDILSVATGTIGTVQGGTVSIQSNGDFVYVAPAGFLGQDSFSYTLLDGAGGSDRAAAIMTVVAPNQAPDGADDIFTGLRAQNVTGNLLADNGNGVDSDPEADTILVFAETINTAQGGTVVIAANGDFTYTPDILFVGTDSFNYILQDGAGHTSLAAVSLIIAPLSGEIFGTPGDDVLNGTVGNDTFYGLAGDDSYYFTGGHDTIIETAGADVLYLPVDVGVADVSFLRYTTTQQDMLNLVVHVDDGDGDPLTSLGTITVFNQFLPPSALPANTQTETLRFQPVGEAVLTDIRVTTLGGAEDDVILGIDYGANPDDTIIGFDDVDQIASGDGNDTIFGGTGDDVLSGQAGGDALFGEEGGDWLYGGTGDDFLLGDEDVDNTTTVSFGGADHLFGGDGIDWIEGHKGNDFLYGGNDNDVLLGNEGNDQINGDAGDDFLSGDTGADTLNGGDGVDTLYGGAGADIFAFTAFGSSDNIQDFSVAESDVLDVSDLLTGYDPVSNAISDFVQITDDGTNSFLSVDTDGGANNFVQIATLTGVTSLTNEEALEISGNLITV